MATAELEEVFPRLTYSGYRVSSPKTPTYNCIAWAVGRHDKWWWPSKSYYWPKNCPRKVTIDAFAVAFKTLGYEPYDNGTLEHGWQKIALYALNGEPTHAARQLANGRWASKLGCLCDIEHELDGLYGPMYGSVVRHFKRSAQ